MQTVILRARVAPIPPGPGSSWSSEHRRRFIGCSTRSVRSEGVCPAHRAVSGAQPGSPRLCVSVVRFQPPERRGTSGMRCGLALDRKRNCCPTLTSWGNREGNRAQCGVFPLPRASSARGPGHANPAKARQRHAPTGHEGRTGARDPGVGRTRGLVDDAALHAPESSGNGRRDPVARRATPIMRGAASWPLRRRRHGSRRKRELEIFWTRDRWPVEVLARE